MSLIENERTKLTANAFNTVATSCVTVGVPAPLAAVFYNSGQTAVPLRAVAVGARIWMAAGCLMH